VLVSNDTSPHELSLSPGLMFSEVPFSSLVCTSLQSCYTSVTQIDVLFFSRSGTDWDWRQDPASRIIGTLLPSSLTRLRLSL
jgi:hypothetical protein